MAIKEYFKDGKKLYKVYVHARGKQIKRIRLQKVLTQIETLEAARREEKRLIKELTERVLKMEGKGLLWSEVIYRYEMSVKYNLNGSRLNEFSLRDHISRLERYTKPWMNKIASDLSRVDGRAILEFAKAQGASFTLLKKIKTSINTVYLWGMDENLIQTSDRSAAKSPVYGLGLDSKIEKAPQILTLEEVRRLLFEGKICDHPWWPIWAFAILTGMRSAELYALEWSDINERNGIIRVTKSFHKRMKANKCPKNGQWRNINISPQLSEVIVYLKNVRGYELNVLPRFPEWKNGQAGEVLRMFLSRIGIEKEVVFHTLRACFATHLLATGAEPLKVMRMGGWSDLKTFQIYLRMAGVDVKGVSDGLDVMPSGQNLSKILVFPNKT